jgi:hypothetical protein
MDHGVEENLVCRYNKPHIVQDAVPDDLLRPIVDIVGTAKELCLYGGQLAVQNMVLLFT